MSIRPNTWLRLALALCCACWLAAPARPGAAQERGPVFPPESVLLPPGSFPSYRFAHFAVQDRQLFWISADGNLAQIEIATRQQRSLAAVGSESYGLTVRGGHAVWYEPEGVPIVRSRLRGLDLRSGAGFTVSADPAEITGHAMREGRIFWARRAGQGSQILAQTLPPQGQPALLAELPDGFIRQLSLEGPQLTWLEISPAAPQSGRFTSRIRAVNVESGGAPVTLQEVDGPIAQYIRGPDTLVWSITNADATEGNQSLFQRGPQGRAALLNRDVLEFSQRGARLAALTPQGVLDYDLASGAYDTVFPRHPHAVLAQDDDSICWEGFDRDLRLYCYRRSQRTVFETRPPGLADSLQISDGMLLLGAHVGTQDQPITLYALPLAQLYQRAAARAPNPPRADTGVFDRLWQRLDLPVQQGRASRSWTWGPQPISPDLREAYAEGAGGTRTVRYYDKGRMEINNPQADPGGPWYVTSGLLPVELISGLMQAGERSFERLYPAEITAVGDPGQFPTYADLAALFQSPGPADPAQQGRPVTRLLTPDGAPAALADFARDPATLAVSLSNGHPVPRAFAEFMRQRGPTWQDGRASAGPLYDPLFVFGLPVTPPVWVLVRVGGQTKPVLLQVFERRVLTYTPANPSGFRVEMGNVGQHYLQWRYHWDYR